MKDFKGGYKNNFSLLAVYLIDKRPSVKIELLNIYKDYYIVTKSSSTTNSRYLRPFGLSFTTAMVNTSLN